MFFSFLSSTLKWGLLLLCYKRQERVAWKLTCSISRGMREKGALSTLSCVLLHWPNREKKMSDGCRTLIDSRERRRQRRQRRVVWNSHGQHQRRNCASLQLLLFFLNKIIIFKKTWKEYKKKRRLAGWIHSWNPIEHSGCITRPWKKEGSKIIFFEWRKKN